MLVPLISSKSEPLCVYLQPAAGPQRGRTSEFLQVGGSAIQECTVLHTFSCSTPQAHTLPVQSTHCLLPDTALCWSSWHLLRCSQSQGLFGYGHVWWQLTECWRITPAIQLSVYIPCCWDPGWLLSPCREGITCSLSHRCAAFWGGSSNLNLGVGSLIQTFLGFLNKLVKISVTKTFCSWVCADEYLWKLFESNGTECSVPESLTLAGFK